MNTVDLLILLLVASAVVHGVLLGAAVQGLSFGGFWLGLSLGAAAAPAVAGLTAEPTGKALLSLATLLGAATLLAGVGREIGVRVWGGLRRVHLGWLDSGLGAVVAGGATLLACWLVASMLATAPVLGVAGEIQDSTILRRVDERLPPAPAVFSRIQRLIQARGFPQVFAELQPRPAPRLPAPAAPEVRAAVNRAAASTVRIVGSGCGGVLNGSGFVAAPGLVVTNAHVVAGIDRPVVQDRRGNHPATPVLFDPALDIAVLRASGLAGAPLPLLPGTVDRGTSGAVIGYPGGGGLDAQPAVVLARYDAVGRDIYSRGLTRRSVYELQARVRSGNSGGPVVRADGTVIGVVFSRSTLDPAVGYALTSDEVLSRLRSAQQGGGQADTGRCAAA